MIAGAGSRQSCRLAADTEAGIEMRIDDTELVTRNRDGDLSTFNQIVQRYQSQVYNPAARILGDRVGAEDIAQETFISAYKALARFKGGSLRPWLLRISSNLCYDQRRFAKRRPERSLNEAMESPGFRVPSRDPYPEQMALSGELREHIQKAILGLPFDQRNTLALIDVQGLSYEEAAEEMNVSLGTVKSRLSRARPGAARAQASARLRAFKPPRCRYAVWSRYMGAPAGDFHGRPATGSSPCRRRDRGTDPVRPGRRPRNGRRDAGGLGDSGGIHRRARATHQPEGGRFSGAGAGQRRGGVDGSHPAGSRRARCRRGRGAGCGTRGPGAGWRKR